MKQSEIKVGGRYLARISGQIVTVEVKAIREVSRRGRFVKVYDILNLRTSRELTFSSAMKFRGEVLPKPVPKLKPVAVGLIKTCGTCGKEAPVEQEVCTGCGNRHIMAGPAYF